MSDHYIKVKCTYLKLKDDPFAHAKINQTFLDKWWLYL